MSSLGGFGKPGQGAAVFTNDREIVAVGYDNLCLFKSAVISSAARDAGNTPTTVLRPGLLLGKVTSSGEFEEWDADASDGTQNIAGINRTDITVLDNYGTAVDRVPPSIYQRGVFMASQLLIQGSALVGHADEFLARRQLWNAGCVLDDDMFGYLAGGGSRVALVTGTADTLTAAENGTTLFYNNAAGVTVTLPAIQPGLEYDLVRVGDEEFVVTSSEGDNVIAGNDLSADSVTFTTASEHLGARVKVRSVYVGTTLKWLVELPNTPFGTAAGSAMTISIATA
jgi:hypothetical protein